MWEKDKCYRFLFNENGLAVAKAFVYIDGIYPDYHSSLRHVPEQDFARKYGWPTPSAREIIQKTMESRYPDLLALEKYLKDNPKINPESTTFRSACARVGLEPPPIFEKRRKIYQGQDCYGPAPTFEEKLKDLFLVANAQEACGDFSKDFPIIPVGSTKYIDHRHS